MKSPFKALLIGCLALFFSNSHAKNSPAQIDCRASKFPYKIENHEPKNLKEQFDSLKRIQLQESFFYELTSGNDTELAKALAKYIINTEIDKDKRAFYQLLEETSDLNKPKSRKLDLKEVCTIYTKFMSQKMKEKI